MSKVGVNLQISPTDLRLQVYRRQSKLFSSLALKCLLLYYARSSTLTGYGNIDRTEQPELGRNVEDVASFDFNLIIREVDVA